jgi:iron complex outermembrane receptor protein
MTKMKKLLTCCYFVLMTLHALSQNTGTLRGRVMESDSTPIGRASLRLLNTTYEAVADKEGRFSLRMMPAGKYRLEAGSIGYASALAEVIITPGEETFVTILMGKSYARLDEVVVSSDRTERSLREMPASVSLFGRTMVAEYRLWSLREMAGLVPNMNSADPGDNRNTTFIRGIGTTSYDPAVATYVDGVNQFNLDTYIPQLLDVDKIEVLRGPQGTLFGRNAMGGVINVTTRKPSNLSSAFAELNTGNYGLQRHTAGIKIPVVKDRLFFGTSGQYHARKGYHTNNFNNTDFDRQEYFYGNHYLRYLPAAKWDLSLNFKHQQGRNHGAFPLASGRDAAFEAPYELDQNATAVMIDQSYNTSFSAIHSGRLVRLQLQTSYQSNRRIYDGPLDGDFSPLDIVTIENDFGNDFNKVSTWTQEIRVSSPAVSESRLQWTGGLFLFRQDNPVRQATRFGADAGLFGIPLTDFSTITQNMGEGRGLAIFGQATYAATDKLSVIFGVRQDLERKTLTVRGEFLKTPDPAVVTRPDTSGTANFRAFSPKAALQYAFSDDRQTYLSYSRGFRAGGLTSYGSDESQPPLVAYDPELSDNFEAGFKSLWPEQQLRLHITAFISHIRRVQVPTLIMPDAITITQNAGTMVTRGLEIEADAKPFRNFELTWNAGTTHARYTKLKLSQNGQETDLEGNRQIFTPSYTSMLVAQYGIPLGKQKQTRLVVRGEWLALGQQYFDLANTIPQGAYALLNARIGISRNRFDIFLWGRNLGGTRYISYAYDFGAVHLGSPRTYGMTLSLRR